MAGGTTGAIAKTVVAPLERCKILFQTGRLQGGGLVPTLRLIWAREGPKGLFRGNGAMVARIIPYSAVHFGAYEEYRRVIGNAVYGPGGAPAHAPPVLDLAAGAAAGASAVALTYPLDLARTRLAFRLEGPHAKKRGGGGEGAPGGEPPKAGPKGAGEGAPRGASPAGAGEGAPGRASPAGALGGAPKRPSLVSSFPGASPPAASSSASRPGIVSTLSSAYRAKGVRGLYVGVGASFYGILPYAGLKFYVYQTLKGAYVRSQESRAREEHEAALRDQRHRAARAWTEGRREAGAAGAPPGAALDHHLLVPYSRHLPRSTVLSPEEEAGLGVGSTSDASATLAGVVLEETIERNEAKEGRGGRERTNGADAAGSDGGGTGSPASTSAPDLLPQEAVAEAVEEALERALPGMPSPDAPTETTTAPAPSSYPRAHSPPSPPSPSSPSSPSSPPSPPSPPPAPSPSARLPVPLMLANGAISGLVAQTVTYPFDVVRRRRQVEGLREAGPLGRDAAADAAAQRRPEVFRSTPRAILEIARVSGWRALYAGLFINYVKVIPSTAIGFAAYDYLKSALGLPTHL